MFHAIEQRDEFAGFLVGNAFKVTRRRKRFPPRNKKKQQSALPSPCRDAKRRRVHRFNCGRVAFLRQTETQGHIGRAEQTLFENEDAAAKTPFSAILSEGRIPSNNLSVLPTVGKQRGAFIRELDADRTVPVHKGETRISGPFVFRLGRQTIEP